MKNLMIAVVILLAIAGGLFYYSKNFSENVSTQNLSETNSLNSPSRMADINGYILSIEGNELVVANEIGMKELSDEEKARRQKLTQEERQALKAQEAANLTKENVTVTIPVGVTLVKGSGEVNGNNIKAEMSELNKGIFVSIWTNNNSVEFVKLKGISQ